MVQITVKDASGTTQQIEAPNPNGRAAAAASRPVTLASEDKAALDAAATPAVQAVTAADGGVVAIGSRGDAAATSDGAAASLIALVKRLLGKLPPLGGATVGGSLPVTIASDQPTLATDTVVRSATTSRSGTIATGGTPQQLMAANAARRGFALQNNSSADLFLNALGAASNDGQSLRVPSGAFYESSVHHVGVGAVSILGATAGQAFYAREF